MERVILKYLLAVQVTIKKFGNVYRKCQKTVKSNYRSHFENRISDFFGLKDDHKLNAIYNGVSEHFKPITNEEELKRKKNIIYQKIFLLRNTDPKNTKESTKGIFRLFKRNRF
jgi:hypothetical protein